MKKINKKGFTLTELIVVIAVIAILAAVLIPTLTGYIEKARISADNQEVAVLNKLLLDAEINEIELENVPQLKKYLEEEMEYDGDYSLGVKGSYLFYDKEKYKFVIVKEDEVDGLKMMANDYALATTLTSPEGLLVDNDGNEVLLVGGNGDLVELVESIRNVGNTGQNIIIPEKLSASLKTVFEELFENYVFSGTSGQFTIDATTGEVTSSNATDKNVVSANGSTSEYTIDELRQLFNNNVIVTNINEINDKLAANGNKVKLELSVVEGEYKVNVKILNSGLSEIIPIVLDVVKILSASGCESGYILPKQFDSVENYVTVFNEILSNEDKQSDDLKAFYEDFLNNLKSSGMTDEEINNLDSYMKIADLAKFNNLESATISELFKLIPPIYVALNLYYNNDTKLYDVHDTSFETNLNLLRDKNEIRIVATVNNDVYGYFTVQYDFTFDFSSFDAQ